MLAVKFCWFPEGRVKTLVKPAHHKKIIIRDNGFACKPIENLFIKKILVAFMNIKYLN